MLRPERVTSGVVGGPTSVAGTATSFDGPASRPFTTVVARPLRNVMGAFIPLCTAKATGRATTRVGRCIALAVVVSMFVALTTPGFTTPEAPPARGPQVRRPVRAVLGATGC